MIILIISAIALLGACCGLVLYACCKIGGAYDKVRDAIDADFEEIPPRDPRGLWV